MQRLALFFFAAAAFGLIVLATRQGIGASPDSAAYVGAAQNVLQGKGLSIPFGESIDSPLVQYPPLYALLLATSGLVGLAPLDGARWLQALLFALNLGLVFIAIQRFARPGSWAPAAGGLLFIVSPGLLRLHAMAWSEALFLGLSLASLVCLAAFLEQKHRRLLAAAAVLAGLAAITRYAGVAVIAGGALGLLLLSRATLMQRVAQSLAYLATALAPLIVWGVRNAALLGAPTNRPVAFHPVGPAQFGQLMDTAARWLLLPADQPFTRAISLLVFGAIGAAIGWGLWQTRPNDGAAVTRSTLPWLLAIFILIYLAFLAVSISFLDANIPLDERLLSPVYLCGLLLVIFRLDQAAERVAMRAAWPVYLAGALLVVFAGAAGWSTLKTVRELHANGSGLTSARLVDPVLTQAIKELPAGQRLYANAPEAVYLQTGHAALRLPKKVNLISNRDNASFAQEMQTVKALLEEEGGTLVYFNWVQGKTIPSESELNQHLPLLLDTSSSLGNIYRVAAGGQ